LEGNIPMKFMILLEADKNTEAGVLPDEKLLAAMGKYNEDLVKAGVLSQAKDSNPVRRARASSSPEQTAL
ncbi:MAG: PhnB protein, partial [bacterium]|nr:PhnB protein [bacterium]